MADCDVQSHCCGIASFLSSEMELFQVCSIHAILSLKHSWSVAINGCLLPPINDAGDSHTIETDYHGR